MTTALAPHDSPSPTATESRRRGWLQRPLWNRFTPLQCVVLALGTIAPAVIVGAIGARLLGLTDTDTMIETALAAGEDPGMVTFGAMFLASPVQWVTGRTQVRVRKYLGIVFFLLALSNGAMFAIDEGIAESFSEPFLVAGSLALLLSVPLFMTSSRWSQRAMGFRRWQLLHKATYLIAALLVGHVLMIPGEAELGVIVGLVLLGFVARIPVIRRRLTAIGRRRAERRDQTVAA